MHLRVGLRCMCVGGVNRITVRTSSNQMYGVAIICGVWEHVAVWV